MTNPVTQNIHIKADAAALYELWANVEVFPRFMQHITAVSRIDDTTSHWVMQSPAGERAAWDVETTRTDEARRIAWNSRDGGDIKTSGQITFTPLPEGQTEVTVTRQYIPTATTAPTIQEVLTDQAALLMSDLRNFKSYAEGHAERIPT
jgi:uncharacterized membrane protein